MYANESLIIRVNNFVNQLLTRYVPDFLADKVFQLICFFKSSIFTVGNEDASLHYQEMRTPEAGHRTHLAGDRMHGLDVVAGELSVLLLPTQHVQVHNFFHIFVYFIGIFSRTAKADINGEEAAVLTSHRGEDGVRGVEAAGGVGAAEAPVRPPVQHLYSAVQCTPCTVQYSAAPAPAPRRWPPPWPLSPPASRRTSCSQ